MPTAMKMLHATGKKAERLRQRELKTPGGLAEPPAWFGPEQREAWSYALANAPRDVLRKIDRALLTAFIMAEDSHRKASMDVLERGVMIRSQKRNLMVNNPQMIIMNRQFELMLRAATELGFTPVSRARMESVRPAAAPADDWAEVAVA
jgi:P27 family predicted phage terminase small subunit